MHNKLSFLFAGIICDHPVHHDLVGAVLDSNFCGFLFTIYFNYFCADPAVVKAPIAYRSRPATR